MVKKSNSQQIWIEAKRKYHLSETTIQMAKNNHKQEICKESSL